MADYSTTPHSGPGPDPLNLSAVSAADDARTVLINQISWGAVFAGAVVALFVLILLNLLAVGVGLAAVSPTEGDNPSPQSFSIAAGLWYVASTLFSAFVGGFMAGRLSGKPVDNTAGYHGLTAWAVSTLLLFYLLSTAVSGVVGGAASSLGDLAGGMGRTATTAAQTAAPALANAPDPFGAIERQIRGATGGNDPAALRDAAVTAIRAVLNGDQTQAQEAREKAAQALATAQNIPIEDARNRVTQYEQQYRQSLEQTKQQALQAAETARKVASNAAIFGFFALLIGAIAAWFGGRLGTVTPTVSDPARYGAPSAMRRS
jgi:hypothetical protein